MLALAVGHSVSFMVCPALVGSLPFRNALLVGAPRRVPYLLGLGSSCWGSRPINTDAGQGVPLLPYVPVVVS